jgi:hypothetical protein
MQARMFPSTSSPNNPLICILAALLHSRRLYSLLRAHWPFWWLSCSNIDDGETNFVQVFRPVCVRQKNAVTAFPTNVVIPEMISRCRTFVGAVARAPLSLTPIAGTSSSTVDAPLSLTPTAGTSFSTVDAPLSLTPTASTSSSFDDAASLHFPSKSEMPKELHLWNDDGLHFSPLLHCEGCRLPLELTSYHDLHYKSIYQVNQNSR